MKNYSRPTIRNKHRHLVLFVALKTRQTAWAFDEKRPRSVCSPRRFLIWSGARQTVAHEQCGKSADRPRSRERRRSMAFWDSSQKRLFPPCESALTTCDTWLVFNRRAQNQVRLRFLIRWQDSSQCKHSHPALRCQSASSKSLLVPPSIHPPWDPETWIFYVIFVQPA